MMMIIIVITIIALIKRKTNRYCFYAINSGFKVGREHNPPDRNVRLKRYLAHYWWSFKGYDIGEVTDEIPPWLIEGSVVTGWHMVGEAAGDGTSGIPYSH